MNSFVYFVVIFMSMQVNCEMHWKNVSNTCTKIPSKGTLNQLVGKWNMSYWQIPVKCGTLTVTKNPDNTTYTGVFKFYKINDTDYSNPITETVTAISDPKGDGHFERSGGSANRDWVFSLAIFSKNGFAGIGCEVKDGNIPENDATVYTRANADPGEAEEIYDKLKKITNITLIKVYQGPDCKTL
ncbi:hypothetical protein CHUAL_000194 [Chamberlinius hualienensis]